MSRKHHNPSPLMGEGGDGGDSASILLPPHPHPHPLPSGERGLWLKDNSQWREGTPGHYLAGIDEAGRGPLAGPVIAAAVILGPDKHIEGLADSKALSAARRECLDREIRTKALAWALGRAEVEEIDALNILEASLLAMRRAVLGLSLQPTRAYVDGNRCPLLPCQVEAIVKGDSMIPAISAASILAKVARDREMCELDRQYPGYGFAQHKGYPTRSHLEAITRLGVSTVHRRSFAPVHRRLQSP